MKNFADTHRRLTVLVEVASEGKVTQRSLAAKLEISLGFSNKLLKQLQRERLIKVQANAGENGRYSVTHLGRRAMAKLGKTFAAQASELVHQTESFLESPLMEKRRAR